MSNAQPVASTSAALQQRPKPQSGFKYREQHNNNINKQIPAVPQQPANRNQQDKGKERMSVAQGSSKRKDNGGNPPAASLLKRLAGPSTGKAGLGRDAGEVAQIIYECSKGSPFYLNELKRDQDTTKKVEAMLANLEEKMGSSKSRLQAIEKEVDGLFEKWDKTEDRHLDQTVVVADGDCFYCAVEELDDPSLIGTAFCVGGGVLTTASYEARKWGVVREFCSYMLLVEHSQRSAMAGFIAKKLCPQLKFVKPDFKKYSDASKRMMDVLRRFDKNLAPASLDEAYLNITEYLNETGKTPSDAIAEMRAAVKAETGLTISAGAGPNKMVAKIAADINKPDGQCIVAPTREAVLNFLRPLSVRKIPGIGRVNERYLEALEVVTIGDTYKQRAKLHIMNFLQDEEGLGLLSRAYLGIGSAHVEPGKREGRKSVGVFSVLALNITESAGCESTFTTLYKQEDLYQKLREIADSLEEDLARTQFSARTITLTYKLDTFERFTRAHTSGGSNFYTAADDLYRIGREMLDKEISKRQSDFDAGRPSKGSNGSQDLRLRLIGLRATNLRDESEEAVSKRDAKGSVAGWAKTVKTPSPKRKAGPIDLDSVDPSTEMTKAETRPTKKIRMPGTAQLKPVPEEERMETAECPICSRNFANIKLTKFNRHLDLCLKGQTISPPRKKAKTPNNAFATMMKASSSVKVL